MNISVKNMIQKIKNPYIIFDKQTHNVIASNNVARDFVGNENGDIDLNVVFKSYDVLYSYLKNATFETPPIQINDITIHQVIRKEDKIVNIFVGYFDVENSQIYIEVEVAYNFHRTFEALQVLSDDILFFVEIEKRSLVLRGEIGGKIDVEPSVNNYPNSLVESGIIHPDDVEIYLKTAFDSINGINSSCEFRVKMSDGDYNWFSKSCIIVNDDDGKPIKVLGKLTNIQDKKDLQFKMTHDLLTKTFNKVSFVNLVKERLNNSNDVKHAFYFVDIDDFKQINQQFGYAYGDALIKNIAKILNNCIRNNDFLGRIGVDEFVTFISNIKTEETIISKSELLIEQISNEFTFDGKTHSPTVSIGVAIYPEHGKTYNELQKKADIALYHSKNNGRNKVTIYKENLH